MLVRGISCHHKTIPFLVFDIFICQSHIIMLLEKHCPESWLIFFTKQLPEKLWQTMNCGQTVLICRCCHLPSCQLSLLACNYRQKQYQHQQKYQISNMSWDGIFNSQGHINGVSTTSVNQSDSPWDTPFWKWSIKTGMQNYVPVSNIVAFIRKKK